jgi:hypothetical protein
MQCLSEKVSLLFSAESNYRIARYYEIVGGDRLID